MISTAAPTSSAAAADTAMTLRCYLPGRHDLCRRTSAVATANATTLGRRVYDSNRIRPAGATTLVVRAAILGNLTRRGHRSRPRPWLRPWPQMPSRQQPPSHNLDCRRRRGNDLRRTRARLLDAAATTSAESGGHRGVGPRRGPRCLASAAATTSVTERRSRQGPRPRPAPAPRPLAATTPEASFPPAATTSRLPPGHDLGRRHAATTAGSRRPSPPSVVAVANLRRGRRGREDLRRDLCDTATISAARATATTSTTTSATVPAAASTPGLGPGHELRRRRPSRRRSRPRWAGTLPPQCS